jgi:hypothetical protein
MPNRKKWRVRIYFRDNHHGESYLSFPSEIEAAEYVAKIRDRFRAIKVFDEETGTERIDQTIALRVIASAAKTIGSAGRKTTCFKIRAG